MSEAVGVTLLAKERACNRLIDQQMKEHDNHVVGWAEHSSGVEKRCDCQLRETMACPDQGDC